MSATVGEGFSVSGGSPPAYLTVREAAEYSRLSIRTIRSMLVRDSPNALPCRRVGRKVIIHRGEFETYLEQYRRSGRPGVVAKLRELGLPA